MKITSTSEKGSSDKKHKREPVILHLRCCLQDLVEQNYLQEFFPSNAPLTYNPDIPTEITAFNNAQREELYSFIDENENEEHEEAGASSKVANDSVFQEKGNECHGQNEKRATSTEEPTIHRTPALTIN
jgi:hypothetical protein